MPMTERDALKHFHKQLVVIGGKIGRIIHHSHFKLVWSSFHMLCFAGYSQFPQFIVQLGHGWH